jgi:deoxyribonuclease V
VIEAFGRLKTPADALLCDGQGRAHPRRIGLASHVGLWLGVPTVGCAKSRLCGEHAEPGPRRGEAAPLFHDGEEVGRVLRTRDGVKPLFVSVGHLVTLDAACDLVLRCSTRYRLPEPARLAHHAAGYAGGDRTLLRELRRVAGRGRRPTSPRLPAFAAEATASAE